MQPGSTSFLPQLLTSALPVWKTVTVFSWSDPTITPFLSILLDPSLITDFIFFILFFNFIFNLIFCFLIISMQPQQLRPHTSFGFQKWTPGRNTKAVCSLPTGWLPLSWYGLFPLQGITDASNLKVQGAAYTQILWSSWSMAWWQLPVRQYMATSQCVLPGGYIFTNP